MSTHHNHKRALTASILSVLLCVSMLIGSTFAWFTDTATTSVNTIQSGILKVDLVDKDGNTLVGEGKSLDFIKKEGSDKILWEPGCTYELPAVYVKNNGNLHLKYTISINGIKGDAKLNEAIEWTILHDNEELKMDGTYYNLAPDTTSSALTIKGHMKEEAGNEYQNLTIDGITINVFATQLNSESDSFGTDYDKDAPALISVNGTSYDTLNEAIAAAKATEGGAVITVGGTMQYNMDTPSSGVATVDADSNTIEQDWSNVTIVGESDSGITPVIEFTGYGSRRPLKNATISNLMIVDKTVGDVESAWEHGYFEIEGGSYTDVVFANGIQANGTVSFDDCTFIGKTDSSLTMYGAWVNSGSSTFTGCTFTGTRGLKAHEEYTSEVTAVTVDGCTFDGLSEKPGIALGTLNTATSVTLKDNTFTDTQPGDGAYIKNHGVPYQYETDTDVTVFTFNSTNNETILNVSSVADLWDVTNVSNCIAEDGTVDTTNVPAYNMAEVTININADLNMGDKWWRPICQYPSSESHGGFAGTINGNGHTITDFKSSGNRTIDNSTMLDNGWGHCQGLIGIANGCTVTDLHFVNATVVSQNSLVGAIIGNSNGNNTVDKCSVDGMTAESNYYIAGIVGRAANGDKITNCSVKDVTITSWYKITPENYSGAIYGSISVYDHDGDPSTDEIKGTIDVINSTWENVVIKYTVDETVYTVNATH